MNYYLTKNIYKSWTDKNMQIVIFKNTYPMETSSFNLLISTAFFIGVKPYFFCSLQIVSISKYMKE